MLLVFRAKAARKASQSSTVKVKSGQYELETVDHGQIHTKCIEGVRKTLCLAGLHAFLMGKFSAMSDWQDEWTDA